MSLLDSDDDPYGEEEPVLRTHTGEPLFGDTAPRSKAKKADRRARAEDRKATAKRAKHKENIVQEKTPKKSKGQVSAKSSASRTPPDSPKSSRPLEGKGGKGGMVVGVATGGGLQPSPNIKGQRKRYSQLEAGASSSEEEEEEEEGEERRGILPAGGGGEVQGFLFSNAPALRDDVVASNHGSITLDQPSNPFLDLHSSGVNYSLAPPMLPSSLFSDVPEQLAWLPAVQPSTDHTMFQPGHAPQPSHAPSLAAVGAANPLLLMAGAGDLLSSPPHFSDTNPFLLAIVTTPLSDGDPPSPPSSPSSPPSGGVEPDWNISEELHCKCVQQFNSLQPVKGLLAGDKAKEFFIQSKLPNQELSAIWRLSDVDQDNALSREEFCIAMKLVLMRRKGIPMPSTLPQKLLARKEFESLGPGPLTSIGSSPSLLATPTMDTSPHTSAGLLDLHAQHSAPDLGQAEARGTSPSYLSQDEMLVHISDEATPLSPQPRVGQIISLDDSPLGEGEGLGHISEGDSSRLVKISSGSDSEGKKERPVRPAPPKPHKPSSQPHKPSSHRTAHPLNRKKSPPGQGGVAGKVSPPPFSALSAAISPQADTAPILGGGAVKPQKPPRPSAFVAVSSGKSSYSALLGSPPAVEEQEGGAREEGGGGFTWKHLVADAVPSSSADESSEKGHSRSTSLDLNKMLLGHSAAGDVFGGMPSAVPPKPPPKLKTSSPPPSLGGVNEDEEVEEEEEEGWAIISGQPPLQRPRSMSTGSMASTGGGASSMHAAEDHYPMETSTDALLLLHHRPPPPKAPKPKKVPILPPASKTTQKPVGGAKLGTGGVAKPEVGGVSGSKGGLRRPPPPGKPNRLADLYRGELEANNSTSKQSKVGVVSEVGVAKDKPELQSSIRSLKENNEALIDINKNLEQKLFKLMEERVRLARDLNVLSVQS